MIGQEKLKCDIASWPALPRFLIVEGAKGSGRKTLIRYIADKWNADSIVVDSSVESVRNIIEDAQSLFKRRIYVLDSSNMSSSALNALLKITEEPPSNCFIAMICDSTAKVLPTLISRSRTLSMLPYSTQEKLEYIEQSRFDEVKKLDTCVLTDYCHLASNLSELQTILASGAEELFEKVETFYDSIWEASASNALKVTSWLKFKESETDKIDPKLFLNCLLNWSTVIVMRRGIEMTFEEARAHDYLVREASKCLSSIKRKGANARIYINRFIRKVKSFE
ncbi:MAG: hypothetical protein D8H99_54030 [Streptococcus sp.]|nr:MAG: hypothetical protein D8H99_54030 [Streptococcus sp.]